MNYYNENDAFCAQWLRNLIAAGQISNGIVDERSIEDVKPCELVGFRQCHFFAGIGAWSYALRLSGWSDDREVWTGSCPCQPFSAAGKAGGFADERHLWPAWFHLIGQCKPATVFGEQVSSADGLTWLDLVQDDMEAATYTFGAMDTCSASVGAPHIRQRLYFVGDLAYTDCDDRRSDRGKSRSRRSEIRNVINKRRSEDDIVGNTGVARRENGDGLVSGHNKNRFTPASVLGDSNSVGERSDKRSQGRKIAQRFSDSSGYWTKVDWIECRDGFARPVEPGTFPLVNGAPQRLAQLRAFGNAINPHQAAAFVRAFLEC